METLRVITNLEEASEFLRLLKKPTQLYFIMSSSKKNKFTRRIADEESLVERGTWYYKSQNGTKRAICFNRGGLVFTSYWWAFAYSAKKFGAAPVLDED